MPALVRPFLPVLAAVATVLVGCDAAGPPPAGPAAPASFQIDAPRSEAPAADFYFDLAPMAEGEVFSTTLRGARDAAAMSFVGVGGGAGRIELVADVRAVVVEYVASGVVLGRQSLPAAAAPYPAGTAEREPDSYHYVQYPDGRIKMEYDYNDSSGRTGPGATIVTPDGASYTVTHVRFLAEGADLGPLDGVAFASDVPMALR